MVGADVVDVELVNVDDVYLAGGSAEDLNLSFCRCCIEYMISCAPIDYPARGCWGGVVCHVVVLRGQLWLDLLVLLHVGLGMDVSAMCGEVLLLYQAVLVMCEAVLVVLWREFVHLLDFHLVFDVVTWGGCFRRVSLFVWSALVVDPVRRLHVVGGVDCRVWCVCVSR